MISKKTITYILITAVVFGIFYSPFGTRQSHAAGVSDIILNPGIAMLSVVGNLAYYLAFIPAGWFIYIGGMVLDKSINLSISGQDFHKLISDKNSAVNKGWGLSRDIVNLFLIFILLYIAIATILQIGGFGAKDLLLTLIIIAFLVNFSLVITKLIIDASNILAIGFYNKFIPDDSGNISISETYMSGLDATKIWQVKDIKITKETNEFWIKLIVTFLFGAAIMFIAGFVFFVIGALFAIRMVVLMILMILAPLAFAAHVLPSTKQHAKKWWDTLFSQAFFAPAALFMLWFVANIVNSPFIKNALGVTEQNTLGGIFDATKAQSDTAWSNVGLILQFVIIIILLCASLVVAKQMGAMGANSVTAGAHNVRRKLQGYAGRFAGRNTIGRIGSRMAKSEGLQKLAARFPRLGGTIPIRIAQAGAKVGGLEEITKRRVALGMNLAPQQRADYIAKADERTREEMWKQMNAKDRAVMMTLRPSKKPVYDTLTNKLPAEEKEKTEKAYKETQRKDIAKEIEELGTKLTGFVNSLKALKPDEIKDLDTAKMLAVLNDTTPGTTAGKTLGQEKLDESITNLSSAHLGKIIDRGDKVMELYLDELTKIGKTAGGRIDDLVADLQLRGNLSLAGKINDPVVKSQLVARGLREK